MARAHRLSKQDRSRWTATYAEGSYRKTPWFSTRPSRWVVDAATQGWWRPDCRILDVGCGAGTNSLYLARRGFRVTGVDVAEGAVQAATDRARAVGLRAEFRVADALELPFPDGHFGGAIDVGCFHTLPFSLRRPYAAEIARVVRRGRSFVLSWVAREHTGPTGPNHRPSLSEVTDTFEDRFLVRETRFLRGFPRARRGGLPVYVARLERRSVPQPPRR